MNSIDLNADLGEGMATDEDLLTIVSSASIAAGGHAGDAATIERVLLLCKANGVRAGAHPGYADRERFGRVRLDLPREAVLAQIGAQVRLVQEIARAVGMPLGYVKLHGALANQAAEDLDLATDITRSIRAVDPHLAMLVLDNSAQEQAALALGVPLIREAYADRAYTADGLLVPRTNEGAVIHAVDKVVERCVRLATTGEIEAVDGTVFRSGARSICLHGDTPGAVVLARQVRKALEAAGIKIAAEQPSRA